MSKFVFSILVCFVWSASVHAKSDCLYVKNISAKVLEKHQEVAIAYHGVVTNICQNDIVAMASLQLYGFGGEKLIHDTPKKIKVPKQGSLKIQQQGWFPREFVEKMDFSSIVVMQFSKH